MVTRITLNRILKKYFNIDLRGRKQRKEWLTPFGMVNPLNTKSLEAILVVPPSTGKFNLRQKLSNM